MTYSGYEWYDWDENRLRDDCWPFQKRTKGENKEIAKGRILKGVQTFIATIPDGWSVSWKVKRKHDLRVERSTRTIKVPFPRTQSGTAVLAVANKLANTITQAEKEAQVYGGCPAAQISALGFPRWRFNLNSGALVGALPYYAYDINNHQMFMYGSARVPWTRGVWKKAATAAVRELLRYLSSPHAWKTRRHRPKGPEMYRDKYMGRDLIQTAAYRKALLDYLAVNDSRHPLPKRAKALMAKHVPVTQP